MVRTSLIAAALVGGLAFAAAVPSDALAATPRRVALVVGNSAYQNAAKLPNPVRDATAIADMFTKAGFDVVSTKRDVGNLDFKRALREFRDAAATADVAVLYYAGHGVELNGTNYLVPVDARLKNSYDAEDEAVTLERVFQAIEPAKRLKLVILDACRDNPFIKKMERNIASRAVVGGSGLGQVNISMSNTLIAYAARAGQTAEDGDGDHSPFTTALLTHLTTPGLDVRNAFGYVRDDVVKVTASQQEPFIYGSLGGGNISLMPEPEKAAAPVAASNDSIRSDYQLAEKIGTKEVWNSFLDSHPKGFYADLARAQLSKLGEQKVAALTNPPVAAEPAPRALPQVEAPPAANTPSSDEQRAWDKLKDSTDLAAIKKFIERYPRSPLAVAAQHRVEILERAAKEREDAAREAAKKREDDARQAAKQREDEAARQKAADAERQRLEKEAAQRKADDERKAKAAEIERQRLEKEAAQRKADEERAAKAATDAERAKIEREAAQRREEDARKAKAAEAERQKAELEASLRREEEERKARAAEAEKQKAQQQASKPVEPAKPAEETKQEASKPSVDEKQKAADEKRKAEDAERKKTAAREAEEDRKRDAERNRKQQAEKEQRQREAQKQQQERARNSASNSNSSRGSSGGGGHGGAATMTGVGF